MVIPSQIQIETVNGMCTARCIMCVRDSWTRKPNIMDNDTYASIIEKFIPYREHIRYVTIQGHGEPLLDRKIAEKVRITKEMGFRGTGFATNCTELDEHRAQELINAGLDTIICSIDGINKDTHEAIRVGTNFDQIVSNVKNFIRIRNRSGSTRVMVRLVRQELNREEWPAYFDYWSEQLDASFGDKVVKFDVHNWGGDLEEYESMDINADLEMGDGICEEVYERLVIYSNGNLALCCLDDNGFFDLGNAIDSDPIDLYNGEIFGYYRREMEAGRIRELEHCKTCNIMRSRALKRVKDDSLLAVGKKA
jgi:hypothetical protein